MMVLRIQPGGCSLDFNRQGITCTQSPVIELRDKGGNVVSAADRNVYMWKSQGSGVLHWQSFNCVADPPNCEMVPLDGLVTWPNIKFSCLAPTTACEGVHTLTFKVTSVGGDEFQINSASFVVSWVASVLTVSTAPASCTGGIACATQPILSVLDSSGHLISSQNLGVVQAAISVTPSGNSAAVLSGAVRMEIKRGLATFTDLSLDLSHASSYIIQFMCPELSLAVNASFVIVTGPPHAIIMTAQPTNVLPGQAFSVRAIVQDAGSNQWTSALGQIEPHITAQLDREDTSLGSPILSGPSCTGSTGVCMQKMLSNAAIFSGLQLDKAPAVYRLKLSGSPGGVALETYSSFFAVAIGNLGELRCFRQPDDTVSGTSIQPIVLRMHDYGGNFLYTENSLQVELEIIKGSGVLTGTTTATVAGGQVTFDAVNITLIAASDSSHIHVLRFRAGVVTQLTNPFSVTYSATKARLATFPPSRVTVGQAFVSQPELACLDLNDNVVRSSQGAISASASITILGSGSLTGTTSAGFLRGVATFTDIALVGKSANHTLVFSVSFSINISITWIVTAVPGIPALLQMVQGYSPGGLGDTVPAGYVLPRQPRIQLYDIGSNAVNVDLESVQCVVHSHQNRTASPQLVLGGSSDVQTSAGMAVFTNLAINIRGIYSLTFWFKSHSIVSANFTVTTNKIAQLLFDSAPLSAVYGQVFRGQPNILLLDLGGNKVLGSPWVHMRVLQPTLPSLNTHKSIIKGCSSVLNGVCSLATGICEGYALPDSGEVQFSGCHVWQPPPYVPEKHRLIVSTVESVNGEHNPLSNALGNIDRDSIHLIESAEFLVSSVEHMLSIKSFAPTLNFPSCLSILFAVQPSIEIVDINEARVQSFVGSVRVELLASPIVTGGIQPQLTGNLKAFFTNGTATFTDIGFLGVGTQLVLHFVANGSSLVEFHNSTVMSIDHSAISFVAGSPIHMFVDNMPPTIIAGEKPSNMLAIPTVRAKDCWNNTASLCSDIAVSVTGVCSDDSNCISAGLLAACSNGSRALPHLQIFRRGAWNLTITLSSQSWGEIHTTTGQIQVAAGRIANIIVMSQPTDTLMDQHMIPVPISANDVFGNRIIGCGGSSITTTKIVASLNSPLINGAGLNGITEVRVDCLSGLAYFTQLAIDTPGFEFSILFSVNTEISATSTPFSISGPPVALKLLSESQYALDSKWIGGLPNANKIFALVIDAGGNPSFVQNSTISVNIDKFGFTLSGVREVTTQKGIAVFQNLVVDKIGLPQLRFEYSLKDQVLIFLSTPVQVIAGSAHQLGIILQPGWTKNEGGTAFPWQPSLQVTHHCFLQEFIRTFRVLFSLDFLSRHQQKKIPSTTTLKKSFLKTKCVCFNCDRCRTLAVMK